MSRVRLGVAAVVVGFAVACSNGDNGGSSSPTGPSSPSGSTPSGGQASCTAPSAPANLAVTSVIGTTVSLSWSPVSGATQYVVLVGTSPSSSNTLSTNTTNANYQWGGVPQGRHYARIQAMNSCGTSSSSNEVSFTV
jgi:fibronectin type III domain protein